MSKILQYLLIFLAITTLLFIYLPELTYAASCNFSYNPPISNLTPDYKGLLRTMVRSTELADGEYYVKFFTPLGEAYPQLRVPLRFTQAGGLTAIFEGPGGNWIAGTYRVEMFTHKTGEDGNKVCETSFEIQRAVEQACTLAIGNSRQPVQVGEDILLSITGLRPESEKFGGYGGYSVYIDSKRAETMSYDGSGRYTLPARYFGASPVGPHTLEIKNHCRLSLTCYEFLQCPPLPILIAPRTNPTCGIVQKEPKSNDQIMVRGDNLPEGNRHYSVEVNKLSAKGVPVARGLNRTDLSGHVGILLSNTLEEGDYTADITDAVLGTKVCTIPTFHVNQHTPPPKGTIPCSVIATAETDEVLFKAEGLDADTAYTSVVDGIDKSSDNSDSSGTFRISLGIFTQGTTHKVNLKNADGKLVCTNGEQSFQTQAAPTLTFAPCADGKCTSAAGVIALGCTDNKKNLGIYTAIGCIHTSPAEFAKDVLKFAIGIGGGLAFLMMLLGAFQMLTSAGNPDSLKAGQDRLTSAVIGLLFVIFATLFLQIIGVGILNIPGFK